MVPWVTLARSIASRRPGESGGSGSGGIFTLTGADSVGFDTRLPSGCNRLIGLVDGMIVIPCSSTSGNQSLSKMPTIFVLVQGVFLALVAQLRSDASATPPDLAGSLG
jgi:hypothetical protein